MREETRKKLERHLWIERAKIAGVGLALVAAVAAAFELQSLDLAVTDTRVSGVVETVDSPVISPTAPTAINVGVKLADGRIIRVVAASDKAPHVGDPLAITEHHHATGRVTYSLQ